MQAGRPITGPRDLFEVVEQRGVSARHALRGQNGEATDGGDQIVEVVRYPARHAADHLELLGAAQFRLIGDQLALGAAHPADQVAEPNDDEHQHEKHRACGPHQPGMLSVKRNRPAHHDAARRKPLVRDVEAPQRRVVEAWQILGGRHDGDAVDRRTSEHAPRDRGRGAPVLVGVAHQTTNNAFSQQHAEHGVDGSPAATRQRLEIFGEREIAT